MNTKTIVFLILSALAFARLMVAGLYMPLKTTAKFGEKSRELESKIRSEDNKDQQIKLLFELDKLSWHRTTGEEVKSLAKMIEIKYNVRLLK